MSIRCISCNIPGETNETLGIVVCTSCGEVLEENTIVAAIEFTESSGVQGMSISNTSARQKSSGKFSSGQYSDRVLENGNMVISQIATQLHLSHRHIQAAQRFFTMAVSHNFNKGRRTITVCASCLYAICRIEKTSHLLIDFSDVLQINVYILGATFLRLIQILHLNLPLVDPALYIARFAAKLEYGESTPKVISDSLRLIQRMSRDWIQIGRRPSGICAAALFIASRMNNFSRTKQEIIHVVKICEQTLKARLEEIKKTPSGQLSIHDFTTIWLEEGADPPSFKRKKVIPKSKLKSKQITDDPFEIDQNNYSKENLIKKNEDLNEDDPFEIDQKHLNSTSEDPFELPDSSLVKKHETIQEKNSDLDDPFAQEDFEYTLIDEEMQKYISQDPFLQPNLDDLVELDDDPEIKNALLHPMEVEFKTSLWTDENSEWIEKQIGKPNLSTEKLKVKKKRKTLTSRDPAKNMSEVISSLQPVLSKKINYQVLENILEE